jgi:hypothetical protein
MLTFPNEKIIQVKAPETNMPYDSLINIIDKKVGPILADEDELLEYKEFNMILARPTKYMADAEYLLADSSVSDPKKIIIIYSMKSLNKQDYFKFLNYTATLYASNKINEDIIIPQVFCVSNWNNLIFMNFYSSEVRKALKMIQNKKGNSKEINEALDDILSGKLWYEEWIDLYTH